MGFCLFNNVAVAARRALDAHAAERVLVLDWDVHHGNGTNDIFHASPEVLFVSIHESPLYPGTGPASDVGSGPGTGYTVNLPVPHSSGDDTFCSLVEHVVLPLGRAFEPRLILISAGYDAHEGDPLATCTVTDAGFAAMAGSMRRLAAELDVPFGMVLEGGYDLGALSRSVAATLEVAAAAPARRRVLRRIRSRPGRWSGSPSGGRRSPPPSYSPATRPRQAAATRSAIRAEEKSAARSRPSTRGSAASRWGVSASRQRAASNSAHSVPLDAGERQRGDADGRGQHRHVAGQRLQRRQAEALALGGHEHGVGGVDPGRDVGRVDAPEGEQPHAGRVRELGGAVVALLGPGRVGGEEEIGPVGIEAEALARLRARHRAEALEVDAAGSTATRRRVPAPASSPASARDTVAGRATKRSAARVRRPERGCGRRCRAA